jgi:hypothetical protein
VLYILLAADYNVAVSQSNKRMKNMSETSTVKIGSYKNSPMVNIARDHENSFPGPFSFGPAKAELILEALTADPVLFLEVCEKVAQDRLKPDILNKINLLKSKVA